MLENAAVRQFKDRRGGNLWLRKDVLDALHIKRLEQATVLIELRPEQGIIVIRKSEPLEHDNVVIKRVV